jgi:hypothetical protein
MPSPERLGARQFLARRRLPLPTCSGDKLPGAIGSSDIIYTAPLPGLLDFSFRLNESGVIVNTFDKIHSVVHYHTIDCWNIHQLTSRTERKKKERERYDRKRKEKNSKLPFGCAMSFWFPAGLSTAPGKIDYYRLRHPFIQIPFILLFPFQASPIH